MDTRMYTEEQLDRKSWLVCAVVNTNFAIDGLKGLVYALHQGFSGERSEKAVEEVCGTFEEELSRLDNLREMLISEQASLREEGIE